MSLSVDDYQGHLNRVSRSFALCIGQLDQPLRKYVSLTYLVCRVLDSVEDARWARLSQQLKAFELFNGLLDRPELVSRLDLTAFTFPEGLTEGELALLRDSKALFSDLHELPSPVKNSIGRLARTMALGMKHFAQHKQNGRLRLQKLHDVNQYCFFVAGLVGETLASLLAAVDPRVGFQKDLVLKAHHFGLLLQKVNLLKDQYKDEMEGRFLVPSRQEVFQSLASNVEGAWAYIEAIPLHQKSYRVFCLWSFFLALRTLPLIKNQAPGDLEPKIPREETVALFKDLESRSQDLDYLRGLYQQGLHAVGLQGEWIKPPVSLAVKTPKVWFQKVYGGILTREEFAQLGLIPSI